MLAGGRTMSWGSKIDAGSRKLRYFMCTWAVLMDLTCDVQVTGVLLTGSWPGDSAKDALSLALGGCGAVDAVVRETLRSAAAAAVADR